MNERMNEINNRNTYNRSDSTFGNTGRSSQSAQAPRYSSENISYVSRVSSNMGSTRFTEYGSAARKYNIEPRRIQKPDTEKKVSPRKQPVTRVKIQHAGAKFTIVALILALAASICIPLIGSYVQTANRKELNSIVDKISDVKHELVELHEDYLFSIDTNDACCAAVNMGMIRIAQSTPIHP